MIRVAVLLLSAGLILGCAPRQDADAPLVAPAPPRRALVEMLSWWYAPGEAEALQALIETHGIQHPESRVFNGMGGNAAFGTRTLVGARLANQDPPDLLQLNSREVPILQQRYPGALQPLDDLVDLLGLRAAMFPEALAGMTSGGRVVAMPVNMHRENTLFFNKHLFAAHHISPPTSTSELLAACRTLKRAGVTPIATSLHGWVLRILLNSLFAGEAGPDGFYAAVAGGSAAQVPKLRSAATLLVTLLDNYVNVDAGEEGFTWTNAAEALYNGDAAMMISGDWVKGYLVQLGWRPGVDFGAVAAPGTADLFLYVADGFALPAGAPNQTGAREFLISAASRAGQVAFNLLKGSSPVRNDVPMESLDPLGRDTLDALTHARIRMPAPASPDHDAAAARFAEDRDIAALTRAYLQPRGRS